MRERGKKKSSEIFMDLLSKLNFNYIYFTLKELHVLILLEIKEKQ